MSCILCVYTHHYFVFSLQNAPDAFEKHSFFATLDCTVQERLMAKRSRARGAGTLPEDRCFFIDFLFLGVFFLPFRERVHIPPWESRKIFQKCRKGCGYVSSQEGNHPFWLIPGDDSYSLENLSELKKNQKSFQKTSTTFFRINFLPLKHEIIVFFQTFHDTRIY